MDPTFFTSKKVANQLSKNSLRTKKIRKWKTGLIGEANGSKVVYLSADPNVGPFKDRFPRACWIFCTNVWIEFLEFLFKLHNKVYVQTFSGRCSLEVLSMWVFNKISGYRLQTFVWNIENCKMKNSCLISKQNAAISPAKSWMRRLTLNELSNASGLKMHLCIKDLESVESKIFWT